MQFRICQELWCKFESVVRSFGFSCEPLPSSVRTEALFICQHGSQSADVRLVNENRQNILWAEVTTRGSRTFQFFSTKHSFADELSVRIMAANTMLEFAESEDERAIVRRMIQCDRVIDDA